MSTLAYHIVLSLNDQRVILRDRAARRTFARLVHRIGRRFRLVVFGAADTHLHLLAACSRADAGAFARQLSYGLHRRLGLTVGFAHARFHAVRDQRHFNHTFFYCLRQDAHHGAHCDPFHEGSSLPDLLGLRVIGTVLCDQVRTLLPRVTRADLTSLLPVRDATLELDPRRLGDATAAIAALDALPQRGAFGRRLRIAAIHAAAHLPNAVLAHQLACSRRLVQKLRHEKPDPAWQAAVLGQWQLRSQHRLGHPDTNDETRMQVA